MIYYVDIDETICEYKTERLYKNASPIKNNINKINKLYEQGHTIVYWTARGATTGIDWTQLTKKQLQDWGAKYHQLKLTKPAYDVIICDYSMRLEEVV